MDLLTYLGYTEFDPSICLGSLSTHNVLGFAVVEYEGYQSPASDRTEDIRLTDVLHVPGLQRNILGLTCSQRAAARPVIKGDIAKIMAGSQAWICTSNDKGVSRMVTGPSANDIYGKQRRRNNVRRSDVRARILGHCLPPKRATGGYANQCDISGTSRPWFGRIRRAL